MDDRIPREEYLQWLREFCDKPIVKVVTGLRRSGKSTILQMFMDELLTKGIADRQILTINFEEADGSSWIESYATC